MVPLLCFVGGLTFAFLFIMVAWQRMRIIVLTESIKVYKEYLARPAMAVFTEDQVRSLADTLWKFPAQSKFGNN